MAVKRKKIQKTKNNSTANLFFSISREKKMTILGIFLLVFSVFLFLSVISYSRYDEALMNGFFKDITSPGEKADINNWLGIIGAHIAHILIKNTLGYFSLAFAFILFLWGISFFKKLSFKIKIHLSNFFILIALILSAFFGLMSVNYNLLNSSYELRGKIGEYLGGALAGLLGGIGGLLLLLFVFVAVLIFAFDLKIESIIGLFKSVFISQPRTNIKINKNNEAAESNLDKIKKLSSRKKKDKDIQEETVLTAEQLINEGVDKKTNIRIIRKNENYPADEPNEVISEERKKVNLEKTGEVPAREFKRDEEEKLPEPWEENIDFKMAGIELLKQGPEENFKVTEEELKKNAELLKEKLKLFDIDIKDISVTPGPVVTLYEIVPAPGVKISKIVGLENDIALALAAKGIRIIAPIPGKGAIGVEIPNAEAELVNARSVISKISESKAELPLSLGKTISGDVYIADLALMPHLLIAGSTGSGKSVGINMIISSLLYTKHPSEVKFIMVDPKKIELSFYNKLRRHYLAVSPDLEEEIITAPQNAVLMLKSVETEMEQRYDRLAKAGVRNIVDYNRKVNNPSTKPHDTETIKHHHLPYLVIVIDELADLMITAGKDVEEPITRLAQLARAVGIHLVLATQRPSVNVITGVIKANFSSRIAYQVATKIDSRTILDMNGAEQLLGKGDMLFMPTGSPKPIRIQNAFITTEEVEKIANYIYSQPAYSKPYFLPSIYEKKKSSTRGFADVDPMFEEAAKVIVRHQQGSVSLLQRKLKLGYSRAARIVDQLEEAGIVGPNDGSKARVVLVENEEQLETVLRSL